MKEKVFLLKVDNSFNKVDTSISLYSNNKHKTKETIKKSIMTGSNSSKRLQYK